MWRDDKRWTKKVKSGNPEIVREDRVNKIQVEG